MLEVDLRYFARSVRNLKKICVTDLGKWKLHEFMTIAPDLSSRRKYDSD